MRYNVSDIKFRDFLRAKVEELNNVNKTVVRVFFEDFPIIVENNKHLALRLENREVNVEDQQIIVPTVSIGFLVRNSNNKSEFVESETKLSFSIMNLITNTEVFGNKFNLEFEPLDFKVSYVKRLNIINIKRNMFSFLEDILVKYNTGTRNSISFTYTNSTTKESSKVEIDHNNAISMKSVLVNNCYKSYEFLYRSYLSKSLRSLTSKEYKLLKSMGQHVCTMIKVDGFTHPILDIESNNNLFIKSKYYEVMKKIVIEDRGVTFTLSTNKDVCEALNFRRFFKFKEFELFCLICSLLNVEGSSRLTSVVYYAVNEKGDRFYKPSIEDWNGRVPTEKLKTCTYGEILCYSNSKNLYRLGRNKFSLFLDEVMNCKLF